MALDRARPDITGPEAWVFLHRMTPNKPLGYHVLKNMLKRAEKMAKLDPLAGGNFHPYRRGWATSRKHWPSADVARLGDWHDEPTMLKCYVAPDMQTIRKII